VTDFDALILHATSPAHRLERWIEDLVGVVDRPLQDISAGGWRALHFESEQDWPAANVQQERRKYLAHTASGSWLLKFAGLGRAGLKKLDRARALGMAGFGPEAAGYRHGFLVERWRDDARPLQPAERDRDGVLEQIGRYLGFRAKTFPAEPRSGASLTELLVMARHNAGQALGEGFARRLAGEDARAAALEGRVRRVETDNRMQAWEWLWAPDGRQLKTDALDHHDGHDLIGCQDIAWDVAGAAIEFDLSDAQRDELCAVVERQSGRALDPTCSPS
jgi:hypothetical protein